MNPADVSLFAAAEAYRVGQRDGFKSGVIAGVVGTLLVTAVRRSRKKNATPRQFKFENPFTK